MGDGAVVIEWCFFFVLQVMVALRGGYYQTFIIIIL